MKGKCFFCYDYLQSLKLIEPYQHDQFNRAFPHRHRNKNNDSLENVLVSFADCYMIIFLRGKKSFFYLGARAIQKS